MVVRQPSLVDAGCERLVPCVQGSLSLSQLTHLEAATELLVEQEARELRCARALEELNEDAACRALHALRRLLLERDAPTPQRGESAVASGARESGERESVVGVTWKPSLRTKCFWL